MNQAVPAPLPPGPPEAPAALAPPVTAPAPIGTRVLKGATWITIQSIIAQAAALLARVVVYRHLPKDDIAIASWAASAGIFVTFLMPAVGEVLTQRQRRFKRWSNTAFWISVYASIALLIVGVIGAPIAVVIYHHDWRAAPLFFLTCLSFSFFTSSLVWNAELSIQFRFRLVAMISAASAIIAAILTAIMAWLGMAPWFIAVPAALCNLIVLALLFANGHFRPKAAPPVARTLAMIRPSMSLTAASFFAALVMQLDNFCVGLFQNEADMAAYALAFTLSYQLFGLLARGLRGVMLPAFSSIDKQPERQLTAYIEALRLACWVVMPAVMIPIPAMGFAVTTVFSDRWIPAIPLVKVFLCGIGFLMVYTIAYTYMQSIGAFRKYLVSCIVHAAFFAPAVLLAAMFGNVMIVTTVVSASFVLAALIWSQAAVAKVPSSKRWSIAAASLKPYALAGIAVIAAIYATDSLHHEWLKAVLAVVIGSAIYLCLSWMFIRKTMTSVVTRAMHLVPGRKHA